MIHLAVNRHTVRRDLHRFGRYKCKYEVGCVGNTALAVDHLHRGVLCLTSAKHRYTVYLGNVGKLRTVTFSNDAKLCCIALHHFML